MLADAKRGDIDVSAAAYAQALAGETPTPFGTVPGSASTPTPRARTWASTRCARVRAPGAGVFVLVRTSNPGAVDVEDLATEGGERVWERVARLVDGLGEPGPDSGLHDVGAVVGATAPEHLARARELMPRTPFLLPGIGAQGGRVEDLAPAFAAGRAGGLVTASRAIVRAHEQDGGEPAARRPSRGRAAARAGLVAWVIGPPRRALCSAHPMVESSTSKHRALAGSGGPDHLRGGGVRRGRQHAAQGRQHVGQQRQHPAVDDDEDHVEEGREVAQAPPRLHREVRRHPVGDLDQDRRLAGSPSSG